MTSIEQAGRNVEEAVQAALKALGVSREEVEIEVLSQENRGLLGILGTSQAKVRATLKEGVAPPQEPAPEPLAPIREATPEREPREPVEELREGLEEFTPGEEAPPPPALAEAGEVAVGARDLTNEALRLMGIQAQAEVVEDEAEAICINIQIQDHEDLGLLIGKYGETLDALQLLVAMIANRPLFLDARKRILLNTAGYRERREQALTEMAQSAAARAKRTGREVPLQPLNPRERRIVHVALVDDAEVFTSSEGEDPDRFILVIPRHDRKQ